MYRQYLRGGPFGHGFDKNEFLLKKVRQSSDPFRLVVVVANYTFEFSFFYCTSHLEGEEVFEFAKLPVDYPLNAENDFHHPNCVNFSSP